jgi:hypothetical protein
MAASMDENWAVSKADNLAA